MGPTFSVFGWSSNSVFPPDRIRTHEKSCRASEKSCRASEKICRGTSKNEFFDRPRRFFSPDPTVFSPDPTIFLVRRGFCRGARFWGVKKAIPAAFKVRDPPKRPPKTHPGPPDFSAGTPQFSRFLEGGTNFSLFFAQEP